MPFLKKNKPRGQQLHKQGSSDRVGKVFTGTRRENGENRAIAGHQGPENDVLRKTDGYRLIAPREGD